MAADGSPTFGAATIKPSDPNQLGWTLAISGRHFVTANTNMTDLISYAYDLHAKQVVNGPPWFLSDKFDIDAVPDGEGRPGRGQFKMMVQKLLTDGFGLAFHHEKRELAVYVITVGKGGPKLMHSASGPNDPTGFGFGPLGVLTAKNLTIEAFANVMQRTVLDRPVVDQTGVSGRLDFVLKWTPDDSQFAQLRGSGVTAPPVVDEPNSPPNLYTAIQEQLGLKLEPMRAPDDTIVIDHVQKPSAN